MRDLAALVHTFRLIRSEKAVRKNAAGEILNP